MSTTSASMMSGTCRFGTTNVCRGARLPSGSGRKAEAVARLATNGAGIAPLTMSQNTQGIEAIMSRLLWSRTVPRWAAWRCIENTGIVDVPLEGIDRSATGLWSDLDEPWREAFRQAWEALRTGNIPVGACASTSDGQIVRASRNRVIDNGGPPGEIFGSSLAHAETNVLAGLRFGAPRDLVLTTTLQPCLQCAAAIRLGPISTVRFAGEDSYWEGCHDFAKLSAREATRAPVTRIGPRHDELGLFATLISLVGPALMPFYEEALRALGDGSIVDLVHRLEAEGVIKTLVPMAVDEAFERLWPQLTSLAATRGARGL